MVLLIILAAIVIAGGGALGVYELGARSARKQLTATPAMPLALPEAKGVDPKLPTRTERWTNEQEHLLDTTSPLDSFKHVGCRVCGPGPLGRHEVPSVYDHVMIAASYVAHDYGGSWKNEPVTSPRDAEQITSRIEGSAYHTIMLDIDRMPVRLIESSTPGNFHLYIDKPVLWSEYKKFIKACADIGIVEQEFYNASLRNEATCLRPPWKEKE